MRRARRRAGVLAAVLCLAAAPAAAQWQALQTTIDLNYSYEQDHAGYAVTAATGLQQKYQVKLETSLSSSFDFRGALTVDLDDKWDSGAATTSKISPSLELGVKGPQSAATFKYSGVVSETGEYEETGGSTQRSRSADLDLELTPDYWPELKFKLQEKRDYKEQETDNSTRTIELQVRDEFADALQLEFSLKLDTGIDTLPERALSDGVDWSGKATYKEQFYGGVDFEAAYEVKESYSEDSTRGAFTAYSEDYTQSFKTRLKKSLELSPRMTAAVSWEYQFDQDLLELDYDFKVKNTYSLDVRWDALPSLKVAAEAKRETDKEAAAAGGETISGVVDTLKASFDYEPVDWLRFGGKAERKVDEGIEKGTGGSVDRTVDEQYELTMKHRIGDYWDLSASASNSQSSVDGDLSDREAKFKADLKLRLLKLTWAEMAISPTYESSHADEWDGTGERSHESFTSDASFKFELRSLLLDYLKVTFTHEYGQKISEELDEVLNYTRELQFDETTKLNVAVTDLWDDFKIEGEIERKASDTEDDEEPQQVETSYSLKLDWKYEDLMLSSAFKYGDKEEDDQLEFTAKLGWQGERVDVSGDYQFTKVYADEVDEQRKLNLKLSCKF